MLNWLSGVLHAENLSGPTQFELNSGNAVLKGLRGRLKVIGGSSDWEITTLSRANVEVVTESGAVKLHSGGGAKLFLTSQTGRIKTPSPHKAEDRDGLKVVAATLGKPPRGQVFVRTNLVRSLGNKHLT